MGSSGRLVTTAEILDGTITAADIAAGAVSAGWSNLSIPSSTSANTALASWYDLPGATLALTSLTSGSIVLVWYVVMIRHDAAYGQNLFRIARDDTGADLTPGSPPLGLPTAGADVMHTIVNWFAAPVSGSLTIKLQGYMNTTGTATMYAGTGTMYAVELRR